MNVYKFIRQYIILNTGSMFAKVASLVQKVFHVKYFVRLRINLRENFRFNFNNILREQNLIEVMSWILVAFYKNHRQDFIKYFVTLLWQKF